MLFNEIYSAYYNAVAGIISEILEGNTDYILNEAIKQDECGVHILDVNMGLPGIDEKTLRKMLK